MNNLYKQGLTASMAMQYLGDFEDDKLKKLQKKVCRQAHGFPECREGSAGPSWAAINAAEYDHGRCTVF